MTDVGEIWLNKNWNIKVSVDLLFLIANSMENSKAMAVSEIKRKYHGKSKKYKHGT